MKNRDYWRNRSVMLEKAALNKGQSYLNSLMKEYKKAETQIEKELTTWLERIADNNDLTSLSEARKLLSDSELKEFKWSVDEYIKHGKENALNQKWMKELENASAKVHISRLESIKLQLQQIAEQLYGNQTDGLDNLLNDIYSDTFKHTAFEIQKGTSVGTRLNALDSNRIDKVLSKPWTADNQTFKDRCWKNKTELVSSLHTELTQSLMRGDNPKKAIDSMKNKFGVQRYKAGRLVMTESAYFSSAAQKDCYKELDVEEYEIVATLDSHTSEICQSLDGKVFKMSEYEPGTTAPPFHPNCRSCTAPYFDDNYGQRAAKDKDGNTYYVPADMKYEEWKKTFVDENVSKSESTNQDGTAPIKAKLDLSVDITSKVNKHTGSSVNLEPELLENRIKNAIIISEKQFGKKIGKHASDYELDASSQTDREKMRSIINAIVEEPTDKRIGSWLGQEEECVFWIKDKDVVVCKKDSNEFVTILKGGVNNARVKEARRIKI